MDSGATMVVDVGFGVSVLAPSCAFVGLLSSECRPCGFRGRCSVPLFTRDLIPSESQTIL